MRERERARERERESERERERAREMERVLSPGFPKQFGGARSAGGEGRPSPSTLAKERERERERERDRQTSIYVTSSSNRMKGFDPDSEVEVHMKQQERKSPFRSCNRRLQASLSIPRPKPLHRAKTVPGSNPDPERPSEPPDPILRSLFGLLPPSVPGERLRGSCGHSTPGGPRLRSSKAKRL